MTWWSQIKTGFYLWDEHSKSRDTVTRRKLSSNECNRSLAKNLSSPIWGKKCPKKTPQVFVWTASLCGLNTSEIFII